MTLPTESPLFIGVMDNWVECWHFTVPSLSAIGGKGLRLSSLSSWNGLFEGIICNRNDVFLRKNLLRRDILCNFAAR